MNNHFHIYGSMRRCSQVAFLKAGTSAQEPARKERTGRKQADDYLPSSAYNDVPTGSVADTIIIIMVALNNQPPVTNFVHAFKIDRTSFHIFTLGEEPKPWEESAHRTHEERMIVLESLRQNAYGYEACSRRLSRFLEVAQRSED